MEKNFQVVENMTHFLLQGKGSGLFTKGIQMTNTERLMVELALAEERGIPELKFQIGKYTGNHHTVISALRRRGFEVDPVPDSGYVLRRAIHGPKRVTYTNRRIYEHRLEARDYFWPTDTDKKMYIEHSRLTPKDILDIAKKKWPSASLYNITIQSESMQTNNLRSEVYDPADFTDFLVIKYSY